jgi:hypothetical protein
VLVIASRFALVVGSAAFAAAGPAKRRRVCAEAQFIYDDAAALSGKCKAARVPVSRAHVELLRPPRD